MPSLSLCMIVRDEEEVLARCLGSVADLVDETVVVDTGSTDGTVDIARGFGAQVSRFDWCDDFSAARNRAFGLARAPWILWLDADDVLLDTERPKLLALKQRLSKEVYYLPYDYQQNEYGHSTCSLYRERIVRNTPEIRWRHPVHEFLSVTGAMSHEYADVVITHRRTPAGAALDRHRNLRILERAARLDAYRDDPRVVYYLGRELQDAGRDEDAIAAYERFLSLDGWLEDRIGALQRKAAAHVRLGQREAARRAAKDACRLDPRRAEPYAILGGLAFDEEDWREAVFWFEQALRPLPRVLSPVDPFAYTVGPAVQLCLALDRLGEHRRASMYNEVALALHPNDAGLLHNRRYFRARLERDLEPPLTIVFGEAREAITCGEPPAPHQATHFTRDVACPLDAMPFSDASATSIAIEEWSATADAGIAREAARVLTSGGELHLRIPSRGPAADDAVIEALRAVDLVVDYAGRHGETLYARAVKPVSARRVGFVGGWLDLSVPQFRIRTFQIDRWLRAHGHRSAIIEPSEIADYDTLVFFRRFTFDELALMERARAMGKDVLLDVCEDLFDLPFPAYLPMLRAADRVICCSHELARRVASHGIRATVVEDPIESDLARNCAYDPRNRLTVGWIGAGSAERAERLRARIEAAGHRLVTIHGDPGADVPWTLGSWTRALESCDVAIAPLDVDAQPSKSNNKVTTYMALGLPVVASPADAYLRIIEHGRNGFIAGTDDEWIACLERLRDAPERERIGRAGKETARRYTLDAIGPRWLRTFERIREPEIDVVAERPLLVLHTGNAFAPWSPDDLDAGIGGAETAAARMADELSRRGYRTVVFGRCEGREGRYGAVQYLDAARFESFAAMHDVAVSIVSRYVDLLDVPVRARRRYLWLHDTAALGSPDTLRRHADTLDGIFCVSEWHRDRVAAAYGLAPSKLTVTRNGIDVERFTRRVRRRRHRFIYSSSPDRGLDTLLALFPCIRAQLPDAELHVFYGFDTWDAALAMWPDDAARAWRDSIHAALAQPGVFHHGRVGQRRLAEEMLRSDVWFHPTRFSETYCITALEAQAAGAVCVTSDLAALHTTVGDRGILIPGDPEAPDYRERALDAVVGILRDRRRRNALTKRACAWAHEQTWRAVAAEWDARFRC